MSAAPAEGARVAWQDVPDAVRTAIERVCGAAVIDTRTQPGGFSPGVAARVRCADGTRWFVKAASAELNPDAPRFHRRRSRTAQNVSRESLAAVVCALAGYFTERSLQPPPPGLPTVRQFQAAQGEVSRRWLATLL